MVYKPFKYLKYLLIQIYEEIFIFNYLISELQIES